MIPLSLEVVTPTLYAFAETFAQRVLSERKESLRQFLNHEEEIYRVIFSYYVLDVRFNVAKEDSHRTCASILLNNGIVNGDEEGIRTLSRPVHHEYWQMAQTDTYWIAGRRRTLDGLETFSTVVGKWRENEKQRLEDRQELLNRLRSTLTG